MIEINLTPREELEDQQWFIFDLAVFGVISAIGLLLCQLYLTTIEAEVEEILQRTRDLERQSSLLAENSKQFEAMNKKILKLESKRFSLQRITESSLIRYLPVILIENLQNLRPEGLWFEKIVFQDRQQEESGSKQSTSLVDVRGGEFPISIEVEGAAYSNSTIADFMTSLKATQNQLGDRTDVRTLLFFSDVKLELSRATNSQNEGESFRNFKLVLKFSEREALVNDLKISRLSRQLKKSEEITVR